MKPWPARIGNSAPKSTVELRRAWRHCKPYLLPVSDLRSVRGLASAKRTRFPAPSLAFLLMSGCSHVRLRASGNGSFVPSRKNSLSSQEHVHDSPILDRTANELFLQIMDYLQANKGLNFCISFPPIPRISNKAGGIAPAFRLSHVLSTPPKIRRRLFTLPASTACLRSG